MAGRKEKTGPGRVRYPIGIKLVTIVTLLLLVSLGAITALVSVMVSRDLQIRVEDNNFAVNRRSAAEAETVLGMIRSNALMFLDILDMEETGSALALQTEAFYFERNPDTAALVSGGRPLINGQFFLSNKIETDLIDEFMTRFPAVEERSRGGKTILLNAAPIFGLPVLAMVFPREAETAAILFSPEHLAKSFGGSVHTSFMINDVGEILIHPDPAVDTGDRQFRALSQISIANAAVITTVDTREALDGAAAVTRRTMLLSVLVLFTSIILIWFFSKTISQPLGRLISAAEDIEAGQFEVELAKKSRDEIGLLSESFVKMGKALVSFSRFTHLEIAKRAMRGELVLGGEIKHASILFCDIRSFTVISEKLTSHEMMTFLNSYMTRMVSCVNQTKGTVDKFMGDGMMAHWGAVSSAGSPAEDALNSVRAALAMRTALTKFNAGRDGSDKQPRIRMGCGINTGFVVAGQIGSEERMEYTVIGDAVNLANRTESLNKPLHTDILITENTRELIGPYLITEAMPQVELKGKEKPVQLFAVINLRAKEPGKQRRPVTLGDLRAILGIDTPDLHNIDINVEEQKYIIKPPLP
ncbi:adenylate/guanylate cyclase domain-containing protein [Spirochaetia bacterium]|nr:adenylate/guanylate cyclase domain-containing protein [Spirochaetia bacterium]